MVTRDLAERAPRSFVFGPFVLVPERQLLLHGETSVRIGGRALDILTALVERPGEVVSKRQLMASAWPSVVVEEGNLKVNMAALRRALDDDAGAARYIATVTGRGYRFVAPVLATAATGTSPASGPGTTATRSHNLPIATTRTIGRADIIETLLHDLEASRLVSIVGTGGIGKTKVALAVAERAVGSFRDGVWLVDLALLKHPDLLPDTIATAIGFAAHSPHMLAALVGFLRNREMLLVLDSCEHVVDAVASVADRILADAAGVRILATSRESLRIKGERVRRLPGLAAPPATPGLSAESAITYPAIRLFVDRATDRLESFRLGDAEAPVVAEICRRLDGLALAIELAATRIDAFGVHGLRDQLEHRFRLLQGRWAGVERHRTLMETLDWSHDLLSGSEQAMLRRLSTFAGAFGLDSALAIAGDSQIDRARLVDDIANLVAKSLLAAEVHDTGVEYRQLDTTRAYAWEKLVARGEVETIRQRHAEHVLDLARQAASAGERLSPEDWRARYAPRIGDVRAALNWATTGPDNALLAVRLTVAAMPFWKHLSLVEECRSAAATVLDDRFSAHRSLHDDAILHLHFGMSVLHTRGPLPQVQASLGKALDIAENQGDTELQLQCLRGLSEYDLWTGDSRSAIAVSEKMRAMGAGGHVAATGDADAQTGSALRWIGDLAGSRRHLENVVQRPVSHLHRLDTARLEFHQRLSALGSLAQVLWLQGFPDQAVEWVRRQREEAEGSHDAASLCSALVQSTAIFLFVGDLPADEVFALCKSHGHAWGIPEAWPMKGTFVQAQGRPGWHQAAAECFRQSIALARTQGALAWELRSAMRLVALQRADGGDEDAEAVLAAAYGRFSEGFATVDLQDARALLDASPARARGEI